MEQFTFSNVLALIGGLALFLWGMDAMGDGLEAACGNKMKSILKKLTSNRFLGVAVGLVITAIIQSSSATSVMVVGFVNAGMMNLTQALWVLLGANIGTTVTGLLIALDIGAVASFFAIIGVAIMLFIKKPTIREIGKIFAGFGILFIGMDMMSGAMVPLRNEPTFINLMASLSNPFLGTLVGMLFTVLIQSSSAAVGVLQSMVGAGVVSFSGSLYILFGMNMGTCITALLASLSANRTAKRTAIMHLTTKFLGTVLFFILLTFLPIDEWIMHFVDAPIAQVAAMHTVFNVVTTIVFIPFGGWYVKLMEKIMPDKKVVEKPLFEYISNDINSIQLGAGSMHLENIRLELKRMYGLAKQNIQLAIEDVLSNNTANRKEILEKEDLVDKLNDGIIRHITACLSHQENPAIGQAYGAYITLVSNVERLSDYSVNISDVAVQMGESNLTFSDEIIQEITQMQEVLDKMFESAFSTKHLDQVEVYEDEVDRLTEAFRKNMLYRIQNAICTGENSVHYSTLLISFERVGDQLLNVSEQLHKTIKTK
ncbi:MAG: Na/Pi cotransporter family protein [Clostridia bacterium]|nr:Na/Pi cotransporter family protein [Clostridia bacterium]